MCVCVCVCVAFCVEKMSLEFYPTRALSLVYLALSIVSILRGKKAPGMWILLPIHQCTNQFSSLLSCRNLADMDYDGKMDRLEFSIAMKLIKLRLQGQNLPSALPVIMKQTPTSNNNTSIPSSARFGKNNFCLKIVTFECKFIKFFFIHTVFFF